MHEESCDGIPIAWDGSSPSNTGLNCDPLLTIIQSCTLLASNTAFVTKVLSQNKQSALVQKDISSIAMLLRTTKRFAIACVYPPAV